MSGKEPIDLLTANRTSPGRFIGAAMNKCIKYSYEVTSTKRETVINVFDMGWLLFRRPHSASAPQ